MDKLSQSIAALTLCAGCVAAPQQMKPDIEKPGFSFLSDADRAELDRARAIRDEKECTSRAESFRKMLANPNLECAVHEEDLEQVEAICGPRNPGELSFLRPQFEEVQKACRSNMPPYARACSQAIVELGVQGISATKRCDIKKAAELTHDVTDTCRVMNDNQKALLRVILVDIATNVKKCAERKKR